MQRIPEPELMDDPEQALAYSQADFSASHGARVPIFQSLYPQFALNGPALDLGCGSGDVLLRFARAYTGGCFFGLVKKLTENARWGFMSRMRSPA